MNDALALIKEHHYTHSIPSGKKRIYLFEEAIIIFAIPANYNVSNWLIGERNKVWELSRLWAPDGHRPNLLTEAISFATKRFRKDEPLAKAIISYADPQAGHKGGIYKAASWTFLGQCEEGRYYRDSNGQVVSRRAFHSGKTNLKKSEIIALGYTEEYLPGKYRFAKGLDRKTRKIIEKKARPL